MSGLNQARALAFAIPAALLGGAYIAQYGFGLYPCEMCWWQRYPHFAALALALASWVIVPHRVWAALAGLAIITSGLIGGFHAGVEYHWWEGITNCATTPGAGSAFDFSNVSVVRCDAAPWELFGISLAGYNFLISTIGGIVVVALAAFRK